MNSDIKSDWVKWMQKQIVDQKTILWFTSDISDFAYSNSNWMISLSDFIEVNNHTLNNNYNISVPKGKMSLNIKNLSKSFGE